MAPTGRLADKAMTVAPGTSTQYSGAEAYPCGWPVASMQDCPELSSTTQEESEGDLSQEVSSVLRKAELGECDMFLVQFS